LDDLPPGRKATPARVALIVGCAVLIFGDAKLQE
jgi:hypothetical protein